MIPTDQIDIKSHTSEGGESGALAAFPFDRGTVEQFRKAFPRARWSDEFKAWFVPGPTAETRTRRWLELQLSKTFIYADEKGRDAFTFDPIESPYLEATSEDLRVKTPYSRTILAQLREVPWAWWDDGERIWRIPFRSWEELRRRWPVIEEAAHRNEPGKRQERRSTNAITSYRHGVAEARERRRHRYPVPLNDQAPVNKVIMTTYGSIIVTEITGELVEAEIADGLYASIRVPGEQLIWATWRRPSHAELVKAWPAQRPPTKAERNRGWWTGTLQELRDERRKSRSIERAQATRQKARIFSMK